MTALTETDSVDRRAREHRPLVLVVDDEESYRQALAAGLEREGFTVEMAADQHEALRLFHRVHPDLVLLDVMLPDGSGIELCQRMRAMAAVPIIMVSARDSEIDVVLGLELGAADYVAKPFRLRELVADACGAASGNRPTGTEPRGAAGWTRSGSTWPAARLR